jgi:epoxide hydrolase-like predicted phosphatase
VSLRALLLDYGGVMTSPITDSFKAFCTEEDISLEDFGTVVAAVGRTEDSPFAKVERGDITEDEFDSALAALLTDRCGRAVVAKGLKQRMFALVQPDPVMHEAVRAARAAGVPTALVSNSWGGRDYPMDELHELFDAIVISGHVGMRKPNADIYLYAAKEVGVAPEECIFVDDFSLNVEGAEAVGMTGVLFRDRENVVEQLERLLGVSLRAARR